jgi:PAS domain-containing protein
LQPTEPLPLFHSWPLLEQDQLFDLGLVHSSNALASPASAVDAEALAREGIGLWECDLRDSSLTWSAEIYDLFGLPRNALISRAETVALYGERSRAAMERLRAYAIKHRRGFTLDAEIRPVQGGKRWMRLVTAPICESGKVVRLQGLKQDVSCRYR